MSQKKETLLDLLSSQAAAHKDKTLYTFLKNGLQECDYRSYLGLHQKACAIGAMIQNRIITGDRVLLLYHAGLDYIDAFFGAIFGGAIAVTAYPPSYVKKNDRLESIILDSQPELILTNREIYQNRHKIIEQLPLLDCIQWLNTEEIEIHQCINWKSPEINAHAVAFLQYTSGSTSDPKGVMVTHENLLTNELIIKKAFEHDESSTVVGWLPMYHDMGLIGNVLQPLFIGSDCFLMSPFSFLKRPIVWLQAISKYGAHTSGGPNFAYEYLLETAKKEDIQALDLSCWQLAFNGSEPVRSSTLERFVEVFKTVGFTREAFFPCYGLAENTLFVSGCRKKRLWRQIGVSQRELSKNRVVKGEDEQIQTLVSSGVALSDNKELIIAEPVSRKELGEGEIGEIWISGNSVAKGYWQNPQATQTGFQAYTTDSGQGPYLRSGDLGFIENEELFVTGRIKELILLRGSNYYPTDIEGIVQTVSPSFKKGACAAFSLDIDNEEQLIIVQELKRQAVAESFDQLIDDIRQVLLDKLNISPYEVLLLHKDSIPKTTSGKIQRLTCRELYLNHQFNLIHRKKL